MPAKKKKAVLKKKKARKVIRRSKAKPKKKAGKAVRPKRVIKKAKPTKRGGKKEELVGVVTHYFPHVKAAVLKLKMPLSLGDVIKIKGHTTDFKQQITSMQIDRVPITSAKKGDEIGVKVDSRVRRKDKAFKA
ncbi:MAG: hypothetical protein PHU91_02965 [Candidatus Omnitrophica bacterium]|nr:hypothetical protein [Candidatus Omnitrophota bacterium]MDD5236602.1 hypothetical protein [Candidatus Omnitrophota bacterium]MDD5610441.1 hypothetical protein [Candidatus Omnitrophota bacterium]